ncbi:MAG: Rdx family protein [Alphaproteobacteria bacterium]
MPRALRARDLLQEKTDSEIELIKGGGGIFDIRIEGELVFSKRQEGRSPSDDEVRALLA